MASAMRCRTSGEFCLRRDPAPGNTFHSCYFCVLFPFTTASKSTPGTMFKEQTVVFESDGSRIKRTVTGIDADGQKIDMSDTIPWDGMEHKIDGPGGPVMVAAKRVNDRTLNVTVKVNGKVVASGRSVVSTDGKVMTGSFKGEDPKGRKLDNVEVFERQ